MAAYGLYTHIASNKVRSMLLLGGLFLLVYVMIFAGALLAEVALNSNRPSTPICTLAGRDLIKAFPFATIGSPHGS
jgi:heat shock protein HtpX